MKRFTVALAVVLALAVGSTALARDNGRHDRKARDHHSYSHRDRCDHGYHGPHAPVVKVYPQVRVYRPVPYYEPAVRVYYPAPQPYCYGHRSAEAELAIGIGRVVGAAIEMGNR